MASALQWAAQELSSAANQSKTIDRVATVIEPSDGEPPTDKQAPPARRPAVNPSEGAVSVALVFGCLIRELRKARGLSQEGLAELGGFDRTYPSLLERGLRTPTLGAVFRLADALGIAAPMLVAKTRERRLRADTATERDHRKEVPEILWRLMTNLRRLRAARGCSQQMLADICGLSRSRISSIERGTVHVTLANLETIANGLNCMAKDLLMRPP